MPTAYVLINYDIGTEENFIDKLKNVPGVMGVSEVNGVYDIVVKIASQTLDDLKDTITRHIRTIDTIRSTMTLIVIAQLVVENSQFVWVYVNLWR
jgi:DNA-binding Lrp family transcriptional regulator